MIPSNFRIEILSIRSLLCTIGGKGLTLLLKMNVSQKVKSFNLLLREFFLSVFEI